ncbi:Zinc finger, C2H2 type domain containing protein [Fonsecaea pedrosoi]|nr:Zinc finger, C2H2 type domain containing protein [Fonsecaea pedrosoi]
MTQASVQSSTWKAPDEDQLWDYLDIDLDEDAIPFLPSAYSLSASDSNHLGFELGSPSTIPYSLSSSLSVYLGVPDQDPVQSFEFLIRFTSPKVYGIAAKFNGTTRTHELRGLTLGPKDYSQYICRQLPNSMPGEYSELFASGLSCSPMAVLEEAGQANWSSDSQEFSTVLGVGYPGDQSNFNVVAAFHGSNARDGIRGAFSSTPDVYTDPLALKSHEILLGIQEVAMSQAGCLRGNRQGWSPILEQTCIQFFHPARLRRYLDHFWTHWYPHWVTIHKPSFSAMDAPRSLVAAMALIGACASPEESDREDAQFWRNHVEEMVFVDMSSTPDFVTSDVTLSTDGVRAQLRSLQAAFVVCMYQIWEGRNFDAKRIRHERYGTVVTMARALMPYAKHIGLDKVTPESFHWQHFALIEQVIRTVIYVFLVDTYFVIFHSLPPQMSIQELKMDLASPEECFQAPDASSCFYHLRPWASLPLCRDGFILYGAIKCLRKRDMDDKVFLHLARAGPLNLWVLCSALHVLIFNIEPAFGHKSQFLAHDNALTNWRRVWNQHLVQKPGETSVSDVDNRDACQLWTRPGLMRYAPEWWLLARHILQRMKSCQADLEASEDVSGPGSWRSNLGPSIIQCRDTFDTTEVHRFICRCPTLASNAEARNHA